MKKEICLLQNEMKKDNVQYYLVPTSDEHLSEYIGEHYKIRKFLSGFTGSAGALLVTETNAYLWTDGRYFVQAKNQLMDTGIELMRMGERGVCTIQEFLRNHLKENQVIGLDWKLIDINLGIELQKIAAAASAKIIDLPLWPNIWKNRPAVQPKPIIRLPLFYTGRRVQEKLELVRDEMQKSGTDVLVVSTLDDIAWMYNLRGEDIENNPVFFSYTIITYKKAFLFVYEGCIDAEVQEQLEQEQVVLCPYESFYHHLQEHLMAECISLDFGKNNYKIYDILSRKCEIKEMVNPIPLIKAVKTTAEVENLRQAHEIDGLAVCRFIYWVKTAINEGEKITEQDAADYLDQLRLNHRECLDLSFSTIAAYGANAAMCHYSPSKENPVTLKPQGFLLVDSGGQYKKGTTDITRTISLGELSEKQKEHYTLVLQGHIRLAMAKFPEGVCGANLDILARGPLWQRGLDFNHGTGHGVGYYLNVHEGPNTISWNLNRTSNVPSTPILKGMLTSNEPGLYLEGEYGIRTENLILAVSAGEGYPDHFLGFDTVTLAPYDREAILPGMLEKDEIEWLNAYHKRVFETYAKMLTKEERSWLQEAAKPFCPAQEA